MAGYVCEYRIFVSFEKGRKPRKNDGAFERVRKKGMKLIIVDDRLGWNELASRRKQEYKKGVKARMGVYDRL